MILLHSNSSNCWNWLQKLATLRSDLCSHNAVVFLGLAEVQSIVKLQIPASARNIPCWGLTHFLRILPALNLFCEICPTANVAKTYPQYFPSYKTRRCVAICLHTATDPKRLSFCPNLPALEQSLHSMLIFSSCTSPLLIIHWKCHWCLISLTSWTTAVKNLLVNWRHSL